MNKVSTFICLLLLSCSNSATAAEDKVLVVPPVHISSKDFEELKEINVMLHKRQADFDKLMAKEGVKITKPELPNYTPLTDNSVQALLNQVYYTMLAEKIGAEIPAPPNLETGVALKNNRFLHSYNNAILRSIAKKWGVETPAPVDISKGDLEDQCFNIVKQNGEIVHLLLVKRGLAG
ncbi:MAG: hypothetical protein K2X27_00860 [Candidatus Obscuribacterales bacterium]|nr:hypothetical protein [Candidatus Obscuribacterales bacterium]